METQEHLNIFENGLDERSKAYLLETTRWTKFLAIMGFIFMGIFLLIAIAVMASGAFLSNAMSGSSLGSLGALGSVGIGILYLFIIVLYFYPILSLFKFSTNMKLGIQTNNAESVTEAFRHQKNMFKFMGILMIILICFYLVIFIIVGIGAAFRGL